jgi:CRISPR-associated protein Cas4
LQQNIIRNKSKLTDLKISMKDFFQESWPLVLQESQHRAKNLHQFIIERKVFGDELWKQLSPKMESEYYIQSEELMMKGVIDALEVYDNKIVREVVPYELKTGAAPREGIWPGHKLQAGAYIMLLEKNRMIVREAFVKYLDVNEARPVMMNPFLEKKVLETRDNVIRLFKSKDLPDFCSSESKCSSCPLQEQCHNEKFLKEKLSLIS